MWRLLAVMVAAAAAVLVVVEGKLVPNPGTASPDQVYGVHVPDIDGKDFSLERVRGKVVLVTNVASECGYTDVNYKGYSKLLKKYPQGLAIVAFPSNEFGEQEPGSPAEIKSTVRSYGLSHGGELNFYLMAKSHVNGKTANSAYELLRRVIKKPIKVEWNFESKILISHDGSRVTWFTGTDGPLELEATIKELIQQVPKSEL